CFGNNDWGQLGVGDNSSRGSSIELLGDALPSVDFGAGMQAMAVSAGLWHTCALLETGTVKCWGRNEHGELGQGDTVPRGLSPLDMGDNLTPIDLGSDSTGAAHSAVQVVAG
ncbi:unnamed protein product, partial [Choristocarpus tenellus]